MLSVLICLVSGAVLALAFPRANLHWLAWVSLSPVMYLVYRGSWRNALASGLAFGLGFFLVLLYWIGVFGKLPWALLAIFQGLYVLGFAASARVIGGRTGLWGRLILLPSLWVVFEWIRSLGMLGFTWGDIGYSQYKVLPLVQLSAVTGVWGLSFLLAFSNAALANVLTAYRDPRRAGTAVFQAILAAAFVAATFIHGHSVLEARAMGEKPSVRVAVAQGNVDQSIVETYEYHVNTLRIYSRLTQEAAADGAELVIWPETVVPGYLGTDEYLQQELSFLAARVHAALLVGGWDEDAGRKVYNSAFMILPGKGIVARYAKVHLVPFGEYVPWRALMPVLKYYRIRGYDTSPGRAYTVADAGAYKLGTAICFESTFPYIARELTRKGAELLCVITNDAWFLRTSAAEQHMAKSVFRAVENGRYLVRGAATGISCIIDDRGRILDSAGLFRRTLVSAEVRPLRYRTPYTKFGDWLVYLCIVVIAFESLVSINKLRHEWASER